MSAPLRGELAVARACLRFFTRLPVPGGADDAVALAAAVRYLPAAGMLVGLAAAAAHELAGRVWPPHLALLAALAAALLLTGAMHEDGLADAADGFGGGYTRERILEIMQDSRTGSFGALALLLVVGGRFLALSALPIETLAAALVAGHALSRLAAISLMRFLDYARAGTPSKAGALARRPSWPGLAFAAACGIAPLLWLPHGAGLALAAAAATAFCCGLYFRRRIGGYTGDCLGATQQLAELAIHLALVAAWTSA